MFAERVAVLTDLHNAYITFVQQAVNSQCQASNIAYKFLYYDSQFMKPAQGFNMSKVCHMS